MLAQFKKFDIKAEFYHPVIPGYARTLLEPYITKYNVEQQTLFNPQFPNELGCMTSFYHVIKTALLENIQNLFIFEDDISFHKNWNELLPKYLNTIPKNTGAILLYSFMHHLEPQNIRIAPRWTKGFASWSHVACGFNRRTMEAYIKLIDNQPMIGDRGSWILMTHMGFNYVVASPPLVLPSKELSSNIRGENKNYEGYTKSIFTLGINEQDYE